MNFLTHDNTVRIVAIAALAIVSVYMLLRNSPKCEPWTAVIAPAVSGAPVYNGDLPSCRGIVEVGVGTVACVCKN